MEYTEQKTPTQEFTCKACGSTEYRQGFESEVCQRCNVPEYQPNPINTHYLYWEEYQQ